MRINKYRVQLIKEQGTNYSASNPLDAGNLIETLFQASKRCEEHSWQICLDTKCKVVGVFELATGGMDFSVMDPASIARNALLTNARGVIMAHNHPSGDPKPSKEDIQITSRILQALNLLGISLQDHIIIGDTTLSMREHGYI